LDEIVRFHGGEDGVLEKGSEGEADDGKWARGSRWRCSFFGKALGAAVDFLVG
jgi:hypothetical protein